MIGSGFPEVTYPMTPDAPFIRAILEAPDDDGPRLIYADWLDEHGRHDRAEFIRLQVEAARLPACQQAESMLKRAEQLLDGQDVSWCPTLGYMIGVAGWRRGFIDSLSAEVRSWLRHGRSLRSEQPLRHLSLDNCYYDAWRLLAADPNLDGLDTLSLVGSVGSTWDTEAAVGRIRQARRVNQVTFREFVYDDRCLEMAPFVQRR